MGTAVKKERIDLLLVRRGLAQSREQAQVLIAQGKVSVNGRTVLKSAMRVPLHWSASLKQDQPSYASRGGLKLEAALEVFQIDPWDKVALDVGASTGGFTDCLLRRGVHKVFSVDVGYGQLAWHLRQDPRVVSLERTNFRYLDPRLVDELADLAVVDVSFISLKKILPKVLEVLKPDGEVLPLVKPQFEAGKGEVGRGGIVRDASQHAAVVEDVVSYAADIGLQALGQMASPVRGKKGNQEFFLHLKRMGR